MYKLPLLILWYIWRERKDAKHGNIKFSAIRIIYGVVMHLSRAMHVDWSGDNNAAQLMKIHVQKPTYLITQITQVRWQRPDEGWFKLNADGASTGNLSPSGIDGLIQNWDAEVIEAFHQSIGLQTNLVAELWALVRGLELVAEKSITKLWIEVDSITLIQLINVPRMVNWQIRGLLLRAKAILRIMEFKITHF